MYSRFFKNFNGAIIPHAGITYAGEARKVVFENVTTSNKSISYIIYIAALHDSRDSNKDVFVLRRDDGFNNYFTNTQSHYQEDNLSTGAKNEHSFEYVEGELKQYFPNAHILVLCPTPKSNLKFLADDIIQFINHMSKKVLVFATTDLIHYGERFGTSLPYPQQLHKWRKEEHLINQILNIQVNIDKNDLSLICGPYAIQTFMYIAAHYKWNARVVDYYDSYGITRPLFIDRYSIDFNTNVKEFVSYVSIIFGTFKPSLLPIDINLALGISKSIINAQLVGYHNGFYLPTWNAFYHMNNGVFIGTEQITNDDTYLTNASYGNYQTPENNTNSATKITNASQYAVSDARNRWNRPYSIKNLDDHTFKIEILDNTKDWVMYKSSTALTNFPFDGHHGMLLQLNREKGATYLPSVARDHKDQWNITNYMEDLSKKAGGSKNDWKKPDSIMKIYQTTSYIYDPIKNKVISIKPPKTKVRNHKGIIQLGGHKGRLKKGYKYTNVKLKNGLAKISTCKRK